MYVLAFLVFRAMGKRTVGKMAPFDVAVIIIIGEAVAFGMEEPDKPILMSVVPVVLLGLLQILLTWVNQRSRRVEVFTQGNPTILVRDGQVQRQNLAAERLTMQDLMPALREKGIEQLSDVKEARLEPNGQISVIKASGASPLTPAELGQGKTFEQVLDKRLEALKQELLSAIKGGA